MKDGEKTKDHYDNRNSSRHYTSQHEVTLSDEDSSKAGVFEGGGVTKVPKIMTTRQNNDRVKISMTTTQTITMSLDQRCTKLI